MSDIKRAIKYAKKSRDFVPRKTWGTIADELNQSGSVTITGRPWTASSISRAVINTEGGNRYLTNSKIKSIRSQYQKTIRQNRKKNLFDDSKVLQNVQNILDQDITDSLKVTLLRNTIR